MLFSLEDALSLTPLHIVILPINDNSVSHLQFCDCFRWTFKPYYLYTLASEFNYRARLWCGLIWVLRYAQGVIDAHTAARFLLDGNLKEEEVHTMLSPQPER